MVPRLCHSFRTLKGPALDICSDKTGTITQGRMVVRKAWVPGNGTYSVDSSGDVYNPAAGQISFVAAQPKDAVDAAGETQFAPEVVTPSHEPAARPGLERYLNIAALANLATVEQENSSEASPGEWTAKGAPTEIAIEVFALRFGWDRAQLLQGPEPQWGHLHEFPFDSDVKKMSILFRHVSSGETHVFTKVYLVPVLTLPLPHLSRGVIS